MDDELAALAAQHGAQYVSLLRLLCSGYSCLNRDDKDLPLLFDDEHFTTEGSILVARKLKALGVWSP